MNLKRVLRDYGKSAVREYIRSQWDPRHYVSIRRMKNRALQKSAKKTWGLLLGSALKGRSAEALAACLSSVPEGAVVPDKAIEAMLSRGWAKCSYSRRWMKMSEMITVNNGSEHIGLAYRQDAGVYTCPQCQRNNTPGHGGITTRDNDVTYCNARHAEAHGAFQHENGNWYSCHEAAPPIYVYRYNQTHVGAIGPNQHYPLGLELEIEFDGERTKMEYAKKTSEMYDKSVCHCKHDGSLSHAGVEIVTGYGGYSDMVPVVASITKMARDLGGKSHNTDTCGQHISVGRANMSNPQQARFVVFFNHTDNQKLMLAFAMRTSDRYARTLSDKGSDAFIGKCSRDFEYLLGDKYEAVNCNHSTHLEVRIFRGSLRTSTVLARMALVGLVAEYCEKKMSASQLTWAPFFEWMNTRD